MRASPITFEQFSKILAAISDMNELQDGLLDCINKYNKKQNEYGDLYIPSLEDQVVELLKVMFNDKDDWISYWIYELEFGRKADKYTVADENGNNIPLKTIEDLWNLLLED